MTPLLGGLNNHTPPPSNRPDWGMMGKDQFPVGVPIRRTQIMTNRSSPESVDIRRVALRHLTDWGADTRQLSMLEAFAKTLLVAPAQRPMSREAVAQILARFHRNSCYPEAMDAELFAFADQILALTSTEAPAQQQPNLSEQQRHAVEHARYQVEHSTPENPECCFDYELVGTLVEIIDRAYPVTSTDGQEPQNKARSNSTRHCPTCGDTDIVLTPDTPVDGWNELSCKSCHRVLEIGRPGVGPLVDPLWVDRGTYRD